MSMDERLWNSESSSPLSAYLRPIFPKSGEVPNERSESKSRNAPGSHWDKQSWSTIAVNKIGELRLRK
ncbi:hypothetical protein COCON_G00046290 [Conger conger]|uniref:Uncharacterized protein n=1 Tax=Conger conger TaxID=82655 RepID=A0A9Q1DUM2_CONCO|nr:hypothetical protein COCON_G00046290 [Conger conger]